MSDSEMTISSLLSCPESPDYGVSFYKKFKMVMNALDNKAARNHVNRMCLAADIPLIESGTAGYLGQVTVIKKGHTECYECQPKPTQKTYPGCTIRNTPSEPIHCIVWGKHLFNQLFGEADADEDVSPDSADPELVGVAGKSALDGSSNEKGNVDRVSTRQWATSHKYNPKKIFHKLFHDDIQYLLSMDKLWQKRRPPNPLLWDALTTEDSHENSLNDDNLIKDQRPWSITYCRDIFASSINDLSNRLTALKEGDHLVWDKDDDDSMDFVTACANIRAHIFNIQQKTRFDIKYFYSPLPLLVRGGSFSEKFRLHAFVNTGNIGDFIITNDYKKSAQTLVKDMRLSYGAGLAMNLGGFARVELNYCIPLMLQRGDRPAHRIQFGVSTSFL